MHPSTDRVEDVPPSPSSLHPASVSMRETSWDFRARPSALWTLLLLLILINMATSLYNLPLNRVIEMRLCREYYSSNDPSVISPDGSIPEKLCKLDRVQEQLAWLQGIMETTLIVCDFVVTIPLSFITERYGVRIVLWLNMLPRIFMSLWVLIVGNYEHIFPTKAIIAGPFLAVVGGECVFSSTIFSLTAALAQEYVQRSSYFSYISSVSYVVTFIGPSLASFTMSQSLWLPFWINIVLLLLAVPTIRFLPETSGSQIRYSPVPDHADTETGPLLGEQPSSLVKYDTAFKADQGAFDRMVQTLKMLVHLVIGRRNFQLLLASFLLTALASSDTKLLVQYISKRYQWKFEQAGYLLSAKALVNITLLTVVVPRLIRASMNSKSVHGSEIRLNFFGAEASILVSILGVLCVAMSSKIWMLLTSLVIYALGSALPVFTMSLVKSPLIALQDTKTHTQDFSIVMLTKTLGSLLGAPLMTVAWVQGIKSGGVGLGLPYFISASLYVAAAVVILRLRF
ncbi:MFS general substrate transporter [Lepidopterella palustris CBS 459.81]|uniref:MFS general substrate transporter n=1 Tax=Lepidopterella palustris CBS 459.81 TaxID=1314670 RepID=A0A8E2E4Y6_9PEZI|nr:MFS general substrate transporter [Lepidopterella palustris CBS 459.81]